MGLIDTINIGGVVYNLQAKIPIGSCATPAGTNIKVCVFNEALTLRANFALAVKFTYGNTYGDGSATYPYLQVNSTNYIIKTNEGSFASAGAWGNNQTVIFLFDGTDFIMVGVAPMDTVPTSGSTRACESGGIYTALAGKIPATEKGTSGGVATLDSTGRVPYSQLPESAMEYLGKWDASTNTPHLEDGTGTNGDFYVCSVGGTVTFGTGNTVTFVADDRVIYNGTTDKWEKLPAGAVISVNSKTGVVTLNASDVGALPDSTTIPTVVDTVADGNMNAVTSNAVYDYIDTAITQVLNTNF